MTPRIFLSMLMPCLLAVAAPRAGAEETLESVLAAGARYMAALNGGAVHIAIAGSVTQGEADHGSNATVHLRWSGGDSLHTELRNEEAAGALITNGEKTWFHKITEKTYREERNRPRIEMMGAYPGGLFGDGMRWLSGYVHGEDAFPDAERVYAGEESVKTGDDGPELVCHKLRIETERMVMHVWLEKGERPLPWRIEVDFAKDLAKLEGPDIPDMAVARFAFTGWEPNAALEETLFAFVPPEGVEKEIPPSMRPPDYHPLNGKAAPALKLPLLGGGELDLAKHKGKHVVVLDFWATWCGPCRMGLPMVDEAAKTLKDEDVVFYAVNLQESAAKAQAFVDSTGLGLKIAMDADGRAGELYGAVSIPQTVIIRKDGIVEKVHQGVMPGYQDLLVKEVRALLK